MEPEKHYCTILIKRRVAGPPGPPSSLASGELAMNENNKTLYIGSTQTNSVSSVADPGFF